MIAWCNIKGLQHLLVLAVVNTIQPASSASVYSLWGIPQAIFMGIRCHGFPILIVVILAISQVSNGRHLQRIITEGRTDERFTSKFYARFSKRFSEAAAAAPGQAGKDPVNPVYGVSHRTVPGGPNPLHN
ncbi:hypothetical protein U1Q18_019588 [Sarracenia purpurea var. burkii]